MLIKRMTFKLHGILFKIDCHNAEILLRQRKKSGDTQLYRYCHLGRTSESKAVSQIPVVCMHVNEAPKKLKGDFESHLFLAAKQSV
jgi:hypothetical protein